MLLKKFLICYLCFISLQASSQKKEYQKSYYEWAEQRVQPLYQRMHPVSIVSQLPGLPSHYVDVLLQSITGRDVCQ